MESSAAPNLVIFFDKIAIVPSNPSKINETKTHIHIFGAKIKGSAENKVSVVTKLGEIPREIKGLAKIGESLSQNFVIPLISVPP